MLLLSHYRIFPIGDYFAFVNRRKRQKTGMQWSRLSALFGRIWALAPRQALVTTFVNAKSMGGYSIEVLYECIKKR